MAVCFCQCGHRVSRLGHTMRYERHCIWVGPDWTWCPAAGIRMVEIGCCKNKASYNAPCWMGCMCCFPTPVRGEWPSLLARREQSGRRARWRAARLCSPSQLYTQMKRSALIGLSNLIEYPTRRSVSTGLSAGRPRAQAPSTVPHSLFRPAHCQMPVAFAGCSGQNAGKSRCRSGRLSGGTCRCVGSLDPGAL
ncbi:uncharacterized protein LAESUDRAFT_366215 [Laetiporus sulphureus 93-53]|uniref:Uncharacterized protein n=1 Tax=Laetiporus sulphureus 93-53 TaxID=1314785 RepID=A0A165CSK9_9APHY|nr:uncharacterized protein LAESUDRAFT_366215 [Laetiporus sulphureus 93-53]KZT03364.1 hypothetical protein LAESUDRAFT_366215 [Laetiporus sulphureus 93-53]